MADGAGAAEAGRISANPNSSECTRLRDIIISPGLAESWHYGMDDAIKSKSTSNLHIPLNDGLPDVTAALSTIGLKPDRPAFVDVGFRLRDCQDIPQKRRKPPQRCARPL